MAEALDESSDRGTATDPAFGIFNVEVTDTPFEVTATGELRPRVLGYRWFELLRALGRTIDLDEVLVDVSLVPGSYGQRVRLTEKLPATANDSEPERTRAEVAQTAQTLGRLWAEMQP